MRSAQHQGAKTFANHIEWLTDSVKISLRRKGQTLRRARVHPEHSLI
jgi:hypothetical protein